MRFSVNTENCDELITQSQQLQKLGVRCSPSAKPAGFHPEPSLVDLNQNYKTLVQNLVDIGNKYRHERCPIYDKYLEYMLYK